MSLRSLPDDTLARVCAHLHPSDRIRLAATCTSLSHVLRPANGGLWRDVLRHKYADADASVPLSGSRGALAVREAADAHLCYSGAWRPVLDAAEGEEKAFAAYDEATGYLYAAAGRQLIRQPLNRVDAPPTRTKLAGRASSIAVGDDSVAVGWERAVTVHSAVGLTTTRPLRGHASAVLSVAFLPSSSGTIVASGASDGSVRLHDASSRRTLGVLRSHSGGVRSLSPGGPAGGGGAGLLSVALDRAKHWDVEIRRCTRTYPGTHFAADKDGGTLYAAGPGGADGDECVRVHDVRSPGVAAYLSLPRRWEGRRVAAISEEAGNLAAAVGSGGVALWRAQGPWEAEPLWHPARWGDGVDSALRTVMLRDGVAYAAGGVEMFAFGVDGNNLSETVVEGAGVGRVGKLLCAGGKRVVAVGERGVALFDRRNPGAGVRIDAARRAAGQTAEIEKDARGNPWGGEDGRAAFRYGRFWGREADSDSSDDDSSTDEDG